MITITEALAELKTLDKRVEKKFEFVRLNLARQRALVDPLTASGGQQVRIAQELQAIRDLTHRRVQLRTAINRVNATATITVEGETKTIEEWLIWRRDVLPGLKQRTANLLQGIAQVRAEAQKRGVNVTTGDQAGVLMDLIINLDENELSKTAEQIELVTGTLDGQLSLKNATLTIEI